MKREDDEQLWELLGRAADYKVSPFFARNVLREIRQERRTTDSGSAWLSWRRLLPASAALGAVVAGILALQHPINPQGQPGRDADVVAKIDPQDYEVVADLDDLLATDDNSLWDDNSNSTL
ncbi:MAG TPA: hypothetical protein VIV62_04755 [Chthoniobacterales bacterium]|jgi:hypothetical protein